jgi:hypothetical protein
MGAGVILSMMVKIPKKGIKINGIIVNGPPVILSNRINNSLESN